MLTLEHKKNPYNNAVVLVQFLLYFANICDTEIVVSFRSYFQALHNKTMTKLLTPWLFQIKSEGMSRVMTIQFKI